MAVPSPLQRSHSIEMPSLLADLPLDNSSVFSKCALDAPHKAHKVQAHWALFAQPKDCPILNITSTPAIAPLEAMIDAKNEEYRQNGDGEGNDDEPPALLDDDEENEFLDEIMPDEDEEMDDEDSDDSSTSHLEDGDDGGPPPFEENSDDSSQHRHCRCHH